MTRTEKFPERSGIEELQSFTGYIFKNKQILTEALTHASFSNENSLDYCNERLEFLGDAVLGLCITSILFEFFPEEDEGSLSSRKASVVCEDTLSSWSSDAGIPALLRLGKGLAQSGGRRQAAICANAAEAFFGAVFLDGGYYAARELIGSYYDHVITEYVNTAANPKASIQELMERSGLEKPEYLLTSKNGPPHAPVFTVSVCCSGQFMGSGQGRTVKEAERKAAEKALEVLLAKNHATGCTR